MSTASPSLSAMPTISTAITPHPISLPAPNRRPKRSTAATVAGESNVEKAWAWYGLGTIEFQVARDLSHGAVRYFQNSIAANPDFQPGLYRPGLARPRSSAASRNRCRHGRGPGACSAAAACLTSIPGEWRCGACKSRGGIIASAIEDYGGDCRRQGQDRRGAGVLSPTSTAAATWPVGLVALAHLHDGDGVRAWLRDQGNYLRPGEFGINPTFGAARAAAGLAREFWQLERMRCWKPSGQRDLRNRPSRLAAIALAHAHLGDVAGAERLIAATPADCHDCLLARAGIAEIRGDHARADWWFARATSEGPSIPFAHAKSRRALLDRGKPDDAIAQFTASNKKGPHFADALEGWGEALMAQNQSHLAMAKFAEAEKYAPNWGRPAVEMGRGAHLRGRTRRSGETLRPRRRPRSHPVRKSRTGAFARCRTEPMSEPAAEAPAAPPPEEPKMEIHKPKPVHNWREFLVELGTITLGVMIALAAEQAVEGWREHRQYQTDREAVRTELGLQFMLMRRLPDRRTVACAAHQLDEVSALLDRAKAHLAASRRQAGSGARKP